jgi:hypothetical protein
MTTASYMSHPGAMATRSRTVAGIILWCLWQAIRIPAYLFLSILAPVVRAALSGVAGLSQPIVPGRTAYQRVRSCTRTGSGSLGCSSSKLHHL